MFTQSAFIKKNTPELREKLEKLGYKNKYHKQDIYYNGLHIGEGLIVSTCSHIYGGIDCEENEALFLAIAALRYGNDYMQWFTCKVRDGKGNDLPDSWVLCTQKTLQDFGWVNNSPNSYGKNTPYHKATLAELQEHFK